MWRVLSESPYVSSYSFFLLLGVFAGYLVARRNARRMAIAGRHIDNLVILLIVTGLAGARIFSWLFYFPPGIGFWKGLFYPGGGLVFYGGVVFGLATIVLYALIARIPWRHMADTYAGPLALGLALGRVGCLMAGCCWGDLCVEPDTLAKLSFPKLYQVHTVPVISGPNFPLAVSFPKDTGALAQHHKLGLIPHNAARSLPVHPVQAYEALLAFGLAWWLQSRLRKRLSSTDPWQRIDGSGFWMLCVVYGIIRFFTEFLRGDNSPIYWGFTISQVISLVLIAATLPFLLLRRRPVLAADQPPATTPAAAH